MLFFSSLNMDHSVERTCLQTHLVLLLLTATEMEAGMGEVILGEGKPASDQGSLINPLLKRKPATRSAYCMQSKPFSPMAAFC